MAGTLTGGLRDRMLLQSFFEAVQADLQAKGWFNAGRQHSPISMVDGYPGSDDPVAVNTLAISMGDQFPRRAEMGSLASEYFTFMYADFYAENDALSRHVAGDIVEFLMSSPVLPVKNYELDGDPTDFYATVEEGTVEVSRPQTATNAWQKHWAIVSWQVEDMR